MEAIKYTEEQLAVVQAVIKWKDTPIKAMEDLVFTISGYAGTGKSTLAKHIVELLKSKKVRVGLSAPTHTAKQNISDKVGIAADTLQKILGLKPSADMEKYSPNINEFKPVTDPLLGDYDVLFIDECSMINEALFTFLLVSAEQHRTRLIFMGDPFQLPPISSDKRKKETISKTFSVKNRGVLDTILRQDKENPNTELIATIINDLKKGTSHALNILLQGEDVTNELGGIIYLDNKEFYKKSIEVFEEFDSELNSRVLTFTNKSVNNINNFINSKVNNGQPFTVGRYLFGYKSIVRDINEVSYHADGSGGFLTLKDIYVSNSCLYKIKDYKEEIINYRNASVPCYVVYTDSFTPFLIPKQGEDAEYIKEVQELITYGENTRKWAGMYEFRDMFLLNYSIPDVRFPDKDMVSKSIDYAYAMTVHKSQGGTFKNVFINLPAFVGIRDIEFRNKLLYVALTRTSCNNYIMKI